MKKKFNICHFLIVIVLTGLICFICIPDPNSNESAETTTQTTSQAVAEIVTETTTEIVTETTIVETTTEVVTPTVENATADTTKPKLYFIENTEKALVQPLKYETTTEKQKAYSDSELYLLAQVLYAEAGGCGKEEMARVGQVVLNRINTDYWEFADNDSVIEVISKDNEYPETLSRIRNGLEPSRDSLQVAEGLLNGEIDSGLSEDVYWQTGFEPSWNVRVVYQSQWHYYAVPA